MSNEIGANLAVRVLIQVDGGVIISKRADKVDKGKYSLFGGKVEVGETPKESAYREISEETGLNIHPLRFWKQETNDKTIPGQRWTTHYFIGKGVGKIKLDPKEISKAVVVNRRNFEDLNITFGHREILEEYFGLR